MKTFLFLTMYTLTVSIYGQSSIKKEIVSIPKELNKSSIMFADKKNDGQLEIDLLSKKKDESIKQYVYDLDLNKIAVNDLTLDDFNSTSPAKTITEGKVQLPRFVQVNKTNLFQELKIEKGYLLRTTTVYDYHSSTSDELVVEESVTIRADDGRKLVPVFSTHLGDNAIRPTDLGYKEPGYYAKGDMMVVCEVFPKLMVKEEKQPRIGVGSTQVSLDYCVLKFNTENLEPICKTMINFDHVQLTAGTREISNKRILLLTKDYPRKAPVSLGWEKYYNEGSNKHTITIINKDAKVESQFSFDGIPDMEVWNIEEIESGSIVITGKIYEKKNSRYFIAKCTGEKLDYITEISPLEFQSNIEKPATEKKFLSFDNTLRNNACDYKGMIELPNKHILIVYQQKDGEKRTNLYYLQIDEKGKLFKQYTHSLVEEWTAQYQRPNGDYPIGLTLNINSDNTLSILLQEEIEKKGKYLRVAKIEYEKGIINNFISFGRPTDDDNASYFLDKDNPIIELSDDTVVLVGKSEKKDLLWLNKISLK